MGQLESLGAAPPPLSVSTVHGAYTLRPRCRAPAPDVYPTSPASYQLMGELGVGATATVRTRPTARRMCHRASISCLYGACSNAMQGLHKMFRRSSPQFDMPFRLVCCAIEGVPGIMSGGMLKLAACRFIDWVGRVMLGCYIIMWRPASTYSDTVTWATS